MRVIRLQFLFFSLSIILICVIVTPSHSDDAIFGKRTKNIRFAIDSPYEISFLELANLLSITSGEIVTPEKIRSSINSLNSKGIFKRISVYGEIDGDVVDIVFLLEPSVPVNSIKIKGEKYFSDREIISKIRLRKGDRLTPIQVDDLRMAIENLYRENGYFSAKSEVKVACSLENGKSELLINIEEGEKPVISETDITGNENIIDGEIMDILDVTMGQTVKLKKIKRNTDKLLKMYKKRGFLLARIDDPVIVEVPGGARLIIRMEEGERYAIEFSGNKKYSTQKLMAVSGIYSDTVTYEANAVETLKKGITTFYKSKGFPFAEVDAYIDEMKVIVRVNEGERRYIKRIDFVGNRSVKDKELNEVMDTAKRGPFSFITGSGIFSEEIVDSDLENIRGFYQSKGFPNARIELGGREIYKSGGLRLSFNVEEGDRYTVRNLEIKGVAFFTSSEIWKAIRNIPGRPINYVAAYADSLQIQKMYFDKGFDDCKVNVSFYPDQETSKIDIFYTVSEGERYVLGKVLVTGNSQVSSDVVLRELPVLRGEVIGDSDLVDFQQRLYRTGLFRSINTRKIKNREIGEMNFLIEVEEADALVLEGGVGWGTDTGYRGSVGATHKNINALGRKIEGNYIISEKDNKFSLDLTEPWFLGLNVEGGINFTIQNTEEESFTLEKFSLGGSLTRKFWERSSTSFEIEFTRERTKDVSPGAIISPKDVRDDRVVLFRPILVLDQRDDPFNPRKGTFNSFVGEFATGFIGSEIEYFKVTSQSAGYVDLGKRFVLALSGRGGYGKSIEGGELPIDKRYFLGGRTTVRGFEEERLGPIGSDGAPVGGDTMINVNSELRYYVTDSLIVALFYDSGSVWLRNIEEFGFDWRETAGYSVKYVTPAGPISFDMGFKLDRKGEESKSEMHFTIGAAF